MRKQRGWVTPVIDGPQGWVSNFHWKRFGAERYQYHLLDRVTPKTATKFVVAIPGFKTEIVDAF